MRTNIDTLEKAVSALRTIGGLPVSIRADYALKSDGKIIAFAATEDQFKRGVAQALAFSGIHRCSISRLVTPD